jgi:hypothetical protein
MSQHKRFGKRARIAYRLIIIICTIALIAALVALYFLGKLD